MPAFTVRGVKVRTASQRRFVVVACRPADVPEMRQTGRVVDGEIEYAPTGHTLRAYTEIVKRSDSVATARKACRYVTGGWCVVVDTVTGLEV